MGVEEMEVHYLISIIKTGKKLLESLYCRQWLRPDIACKGVARPADSTWMNCQAPAGRFRLRVHNLQ